MRKRCGTSGGRDVSEIKQPKQERGQSAAHVRAPRQEKEAAELIRGRTTPGSGAGHQKGDARRRKLVRVECKATTNASFRVTEEVIQKLQAAVFGADEVPVIEVEINVGKKNWNRFYVVPDVAMDDLLERLTRDPTS